MIAYKLLKQEQREETSRLQRQLVKANILKEDSLRYAEQYLISIEMYDITMLQNQHFREYKEFLRKQDNLAIKQIQEMCGALRRVQTAWIESEYSELIDEVERCDTAEKGLKGNVKWFMIRQGIHSVQEVNYRLREIYENELKKTRSSKKVSEYLKAFDRIKQYSIQEEMRTLAGRKRNRLKYEGQIIFLPYLPDQKVAADFDKIQDKKELIWDFSKEVPEKLKKQVFEVLMYALEKVKDGKDRRVRFLLPLRWMCEFCICEGIEDIECMELDQVSRLENLVKEKVVNYKNSMQIVDNSRKILFMGGKDIHWHANVWYIERFHLAPERVNASNPVQRLSFYEVLNMKNRGLLQEYAQYLIGLSDLTIGNIREQLGTVKRFLMYFDNEKGMDSICQIEEKQIKEYFDTYDEKELKDVSINKYIFDIARFFLYLNSKNYIRQCPFDPNYYAKKVMPVHHNRSVEEDMYMMLLKKLYLFPEKHRLIFLHLWAVGLRISEVCTLKGNAYYWDGQDAWIKVYQIKAKADKTIPIPLVLYKIMKDYIRKNRIKPKEYIFKNQSGGAYRYAAFMKEFQKKCAQIGMAEFGYVFQSHDYRHTLATRFYDDGVSLQTIRDYLGHDTEEMTLQYIDYMPRKIDKTSEEFFQDMDNDIASAIVPLKRGVKNEE